MRGVRIAEHAKRNGAISRSKEIENGGGDRGALVRNEWLPD
jgi:hypothetical protein